MPDKQSTDTSLQNRKLQKTSHPSKAEANMVSTGINQQESQVGTKTTRSTRIQMDMESSQLYV